MTIGFTRQERSEHGLSEARREPTGEHIQRIVQITATLCGEPRDSFDHAIVKTCLWLKRSKHVSLPAHAWEGAPFSLEGLSAQHVEAVRLASARIWSLRFDDPDAHVAQRSWVTEIAVAAPEDGGAAMFGLRLTCVSPQGVARPIRTVPTLIRHIADKPGLQSCGWPLTERHTALESEAGAEHLIALLTNPERRRPVVVFSLADSAHYAEQRARALARASVGAAHVVTLDEAGAWALSERLGNRCSVYGGAVRTYLSGFHAGDAPFRHPLMLRTSLEEMEAAGTLIDQMTQNTLAASIQQRDWRHAMPTFAEFKQRALRERRQSLEHAEPGADATIRAGLAEELELLQRRADEDRRTYTALLEDAEAERDAAREENARLRERVFSLRAQNDALQAALGEEPSRAVVEPKGTTADYQSLFDWVEEYLGERIEIAGRARRDAKNAPPEHLERSWLSLRLLANEYRRMRAGEPGAREDWVAALEAAELSEAAIFADPSAAGVYAESYSVQPRDGRRMALDRHLKRGTSHDPRHAFRLYYAWDEQRGRVVVGSFPGHLRNGLT
jgi:hypothetical protein